jgi:hypothetical protein
MNLWDLVKEVPILDVAQELGIKVVKPGPVNSMAVCPFHDDHVGGGGKPNLSLHKPSNTFLCFNCGAKGSVIDFYAKACHIEPEEALKALAAKYHIQDPMAAYGHSGGKPGPQTKPKGAPAQDDDDPEDEKPKAKTKKVKEPWDAARIEKACARLFEPANADHLQYFCNLRKVSPEYVKAKKIGLDMVWGINDEKAADLAYTIPVFDKEGKVLAIRTHSRLWRKNKKFIAGFTSKVFYDLTTFNPDAPEVHVCEGEGDALTLDHQLHRNVLTSMAGAATIPLVFQENMAVLGDLTKKTRIVFYPDNDDVGRECMARIRFLLPKEAPCFRVCWPPNYAQKQDVSHWLNELGRTAEELDALIKSYSWDEAQEDLLQIEKKKQLIEEMKKLGIRVKEEANAYWRMKKAKGGEIGWEPISNFVIRGKATIEVGSQAYTRADIVPMEGAPELDRQLPPDMWLGKRDFLKAFPHTKYQFYGSDNDIQQIKGLIVKTIPKDAVKKGVEIIGIHGDTFVGPGFAISKDGVIENPPVEYVKQNLPIEESIALVLVSDAKPILQEFLDNVVKVNRPKVIVPTLGWMVACFFKERVRALIQYFPILSFFGTSGSGKTTFCQTVLRIFGVKKNQALMNANMSQFTAMRSLACTNCIPLAVDELKEDAGPLIIDFWKRHARSAYGGETEVRGKQDLSVKSYTYRAPLLIVGEMSILREKATLERTISVEPKLSDHTPETRDAFHALRNLEIEALFPKIVQWVLSEGSTRFLELWEKGKESLKAMQFPGLPPRVWDNYTTVMFGIESLEAFAKTMGVEFAVPQETRKEAIQALVGEVLTVSKRTKLGFDDFLEALSIMAKDGIVKNDKDYVRKGEWLYVHLPSCVAAFRKWSRDTRHDGDVLGKKEYRAQAKEIMKMATGRYIFDCDKVWRLGENVFRTIQLSLRRAEYAGLDVAGFGFTSRDVPYDEENPASSGSEETDAQIPAELTEENPPEPAPEDPQDGDLFDSQET